MTVEATILRVVGYILSLPTESRDREAIRLQRYARLYKTKLSDDVLMQIEEAQFNELYQQLFPLVHQHAIRTEEAPVYDSPSIISPLNNVEAVTDKPSVDSSESAQESKVDSSETNEPNIENVFSQPSESTQGETVLEPLSSETGHVEKDQLQEHTQEADSENLVQDNAPATSQTETTEPEWPKRLRNKLLKRFRTSKNNRSNRSVFEKHSRWEFWHSNVAIGYL